MIEVIDLPLSEIIVLDRGRTEFGDLHSLAASIKQNGLIHIPPVWRRPDGTYQLLAGERRLKAHALMEKQTMPCRVFDHELSELEIKNIELAENLDRLDFTWTEKITLQKRIHDIQVQIHGEKHSTAKDASGWSIGDTANLTGKSKGIISENLRLASALEQIPELADCKDRKEAIKTLRKLTGEVLRAELVAKLEDEASEISLDATQQVIIDNYVLNDFLIGVEKFPTEFFDLAEIDPPYAIELNEVKKGEETNVEEYNEIPTDKYLAFMTKVIDQTWRVLKSGGWMILWHASEWSHELFHIAQMRGFEGTKITANWSKQSFSGQANHPDIYLANTYERFFYLRKGGATILKQGRSNEFKYPTVPSSRKLHPTERPIELIEEVLKTFVLPGSNILIPFLGSGNTILAAYNLQMKAVGFELSKEYRDGFIMKVIAGKPGSYKSFA